MIGISKYLNFLSSLTTKSYISGYNLQVIYKVVVNTCSWFGSELKQVLHLTNHEWFIILSQVSISNSQVCIHLSISFPFQRESSPRLVWWPWRFYTYRALSTCLGWCQLLSSQPVRSSSSSKATTLVVPMTRTVTSGDRSFAKPVLELTSCLSEEVKFHRTIQNTAEICIWLSKIWISLPVFYLLL